MKIPTVSVVIPTFNRPILLRDAVQSVLAQTVPVCEIVIIDDGSEGRLHTQIQEVARLGSQISVNRFQSTRGVSVARNLGLEKAKGDYILFLDDDDLIHPQMIESSLSIFQENSRIDIVTCLSKAFIDPSPSERLLPSDSRGESIDPLKVKYPLNHPDFIQLEHIPFSALLRFTLIINSCLVKKDCIKNVRFPEDLTAGEDTYFWLSLASQGCNFALNRQSHAYVRYHGHSCRLRVDYDNATIKFFNKLLHSRMLRNRHDSFLVHAHIALKLLRMKRLEVIGHLLFMLRSPDLIVKYVRSYYSEGNRKMRHLYRFLEESRNSLSIEEGDIPISCR